MPFRNKGEKKKGGKHSENQSIDPFNKFVVELSPGKSRSKLMLYIPLIINYTTFCLLTVSNTNYKWEIVFHFAILLGITFFVSFIKIL